ncbi:MAG: hypothetical protein HYZ53_05705 [Planctomycetes bacterium]|nr:hypothetical protein [Planctomycetota bacterium]
MPHPDPQEQQAGAQPVGAPTAEEAASVRDLLRKEDTKQAVERAKELHKRLETSASEALLAEAYLARIRALRARGLDLEASSLAQIVAKRCPSARSTLAQLFPTASAQAAPPDEYLRPLNDPDLPAEQRAAIEEKLRTSCTDPAALALSSVLSSDHPLRKAAAAVAKAFAAVTSGPVQDADVALPELSRRSPLAPWKLLIRAIACFHRNEDAACEAALAAIDPGAAPARLATALRALLSRTPSPPPPPTPPPAKAALAALLDGVRGGAETLATALHALDSALGGRKQARTRNTIERAVAACERLRPDLLPRVRQEVFVRALAARIPLARTRAALGGMPTLDARLWRLYARALDGLDAPLQACSVWEEFRKHALQEGRFPAKGPDVAALYLHMADLLQTVPEDRLEEARVEFKHNFRGYQGYACDPPLQAFRRAPDPHQQPTDFYFLNTGELLRRACEADADPELFRRRMAWTQSRDANGKAVDEVALEWHHALPGEVAPLLVLLHSAERRDALKKALGYLKLAEGLDGLNPDVRRAALRLHVAITLRHLRERQTQLVHKDLEQLEALPQSKEGRRAALVSALGWLRHALEGHAEETARLLEETERRMDGNEAGLLLLGAVAHACKAGKWAPALPLAPLADRAAAGRLARATAAACALGEDAELSVEIPPAWESSLLGELRRGAGSLEPPELRALTEVALRQGRRSLAYAATGAGLARGGPSTARFLLLRAQCLQGGAVARRLHDLAAAAELARAQRDMDLANEACELRFSTCSGLRGAFPMEWQASASELSMSRETADKVLAWERAAPATPDAYEMELDGAFMKSCGCDICRAADERRSFFSSPLDPEDPDLTEEDDEEFLPWGEDAEAGEGLEEDLGDESVEEMLEGFPLPPGLPPEALPLFAELLSKHMLPGGGLPTPEVIMRRDPDLMRRIEEVLARSSSGPGFPGLDLDLPPFPGAGRGGRGSGSKRRKKRGRR